MQADNSIDNGFWRLISPFGNDVFLSFFQDVDTLALPATGTYTLLVEGRVYEGGAPDTYTVNVQPMGNVPPKPFTGTPSRLGTTIAGDIGVENEQDAYIFTLAANANLYFDSLVNSNNLNWTLVGPDGTAANQRSFTDQFTSLTELRLVAGDYQLAVAASSGVTSAYQFRLLDLASAATIVPGTPVTGALNPANMTDHFKFTAAAGDRFYFDQQASSGMPSSSWRLLDLFGNELFQTGFGDVDTLTLFNAGTYTLLVEGSRFDSGIGNYTFNVQPVAPVVEQALALGGTVNNTIALPGEHDAYTFTLAADANLYFDSLTDRFDLNWSLVGPAGTAVDQRSFSGSDQFADFTDLRLVAGNYTLTIDGLTDAAGDYAFRLLDLATATVITPALPVMGNLVPANITNLYRFGAAAGQRLFFDQLMLDETIDDASWRLIDPYGNEVFNSSFLDDPDRVTLPADGTYTLLVEGFVSNGGIGKVLMLTGAFGAMAGDIGDNELTSLEVTVSGPAGNIEFDRYVSSEANFDFLTFFIDGVEQDAWPARSWPRPATTVTIP